MAKYEPRAGLYRGWEKSFLPPSTMGGANRPRQGGMVDNLLNPSPYQRTGIIDFGLTQLYISFKSSLFGCPDT